MHVLQKSIYHPNWEPGVPKASMDNSDRDFLGCKTVVLQMVTTVSEELAVTLTMEATITTSALVCVGLLFNNNVSIKTIQRQLVRWLKNMEQLVESELIGETRLLGENQSQCHFVFHKSHMTWPGIKLGPCGWKPAINALIYGTAQKNC